jgi:hypothetical protein
VVAKLALLTITLAALLLACGGSSDDAPEFAPAPEPTDIEAATDTGPDPQPDSSDYAETVPASPPEPEYTSGQEEPPSPDELEDQETSEIGDAPDEIDVPVPSAPDATAGDGAGSGPEIDDTSAAPSSDDGGGTALATLNCIEDLQIRIAYISIQPPEIVFEYTLPQDVWAWGQPWRINGVFLFNDFQDGIGALQSPVFAAPPSGQFEFDLAPLEPDRDYVEVYVDVSDELTDNGFVISYKRDGTTIYCKGALTSR